MAGKIRLSRAAHMKNEPFRVMADLGLVILLSSSALFVSAWFSSHNQTSAAVAHVLVERAALSMDAELEGLRAPALAKAVTDNLPEASRNLFMSSADVKSSPLSMLKAFASRWGLAASDRASEAGSSNIPERWAQVVETGIEPHTLVLRIVVALPDPELAVSVANALARKYVETAPQAHRVGETEPLQQKIETLQRRLQTARASTSVEVPESDQLRQRDETIAELLKQKRIFDAAEQLDSESLRALALERLKVKEEIAVQSRTLLDQHPRMIELKEQLARLEAEVRNGVVVAATALHRQVQRIEGGVKTAQIDDVASLEQQLTMLQQKLNDELLRVANGNAASIVAQPDRIVVPAELPTPVLFWQSVAKSRDSALYGAGMGLGLAVLRRAGRRSKSILLRPVALSKPRSVSALAESEAQLQDFLAFTEAARTQKLTASISRFHTANGEAARLSEVLGSKEAHHVILNMSAGVQGGLVGQLLAQDHTASICLIDLQRSGAKNQPGLSEVLNGDIALDDAILRDASDKFDYMPPGVSHRSSFGLELVVLTLQDFYEIVVIEGIDVLSDDFETLSSLITVCLLPARDAVSETDLYTEQVLVSENCPHILFEANSDSVRRKAA